jgi:uncharacterized membrane protein
MSELATKVQLDLANVEQTETVLTFLGGTLQKAAQEAYEPPLPFIEIQKSRRRRRALENAIHEGPVRRQSGCVPPELRPAFFCDMASDILGKHHPSFLRDLFEFLSHFISHLIKYCVDVLFGKSALALYFCASLVEWAPRVLGADLNGLGILRSINFFFQRSELRSALFTVLLLASWLLGSDGIAVVSRAGLFQLRFYVYIEARQGFPGVVEQMGVREARWPVLRAFCNIVVRSAMTLVAFAMGFLLVCMAMVVLVIGSSWVVAKITLPTTFIRQHSTLLHKLAALFWVAFPLIVSQNLRVSLWQFVCSTAIVAHRRLFARTVPRLSHISTDICGICHDELDAAPLVYCRFGCGRSLHENCQKAWLQTRNHCIFCNAWWV